MALNIGHVDMEPGAVFVDRGKGQKDRTTYASPHTLKQVALYLSLSSTSDDAPTGKFLDQYRLEAASVDQIYKEMRFRLWHHESDDIYFEEEAAFAAFEETAKRLLNEREELLIACNVGGCGENENELGPNL